MKKHTQKYCVIFVNLYSASYVTNCLWTLVTWESEASLDTSGALQTSVCMSCNKPKWFKNIKLLMQMTWCRKALIRNFCSFACVQSNLYRAGNLQRCYSQAAPPPPPCMHQLHHHHHPVFNLLRVRTTVGEYSDFSLTIANIHFDLHICGPRLWNSLICSIRLPPAVC